MIPGTRITLLIQGTGSQFPVPTKTNAHALRKNSEHVPAFGSSDSSEKVLEIVF